MERRAGAWIKLVALVATIALLAGCSAPKLSLPGVGADVAAPAAIRQAPPLVGRVDFGAGATSQIQAALSEVAYAATVSLIDTNTGYTQATTVTDSIGRFVLSFSGGYVPISDKIYYLEAIKGLKAGTELPNRTGAVAARVRTLIRYHGGWQSITGSNVTISPSTTALCTILSLRSMTPPESGRQLDPATLFGIMGTSGSTPTTPTPYTYADPDLLPPAMVTSAYLLVRRALAADADPVRNISLDPADPRFDTLLEIPKVVSVAAISPNNQVIGLDVEIVGSGFSATASENIVEFPTSGGGTATAAVRSVSADLARLTVTVPSGAVTGPISVTLGGRKMIGPLFYPVSQSGHDGMDSSGNLYVANDGFGSIARVNPAGQLTTFATGLVSPRALTVRSGKIFVASAGSFRGVVAVDLAAPTSTASFGTPGILADPRGITFDALGRLFVADGDNNRIYRIDATGSMPVSLSLSGASLNGPRGIAFGSDGKLYVANSGANNVLAIDLGTATANVFLTGFAAPWGLAFDGLGNLYISNNKGDSIYRWTITSGLTAFADMPSPGGLIYDSSGYLYAIDSTSNNVYRITATGAALLHASGVSSPTGIAKVGNSFYVLSQSNNSLLQIDTTTTAVSVLARGFNKPLGLTYDDVRDCFYVSNPGNGTICRVNRNSGAVSTVLVNTGSGSTGAGGIMYGNNRLWVPSGGNVVGYDVTNFAAAPVIRSSVMYGMNGVAKDTSGGPNDGSLYLAANTRILRIVGDGAWFGSANGGNYLTVFKDNVADPSLVDPRDVTVDASGRIWVVDYGSNKLLSYYPDGNAYLAPITAGISGPAGINWDGTSIWVANRSTRNITAYNPASGALTATLATGTDTPGNLAFSGTTLYVALDQGLGRITSYATAPAYSRIYSGLTNLTDVEAGSDGSIYTLDGTGYRILPDLSTHVVWYRNYSTPKYMWQIPGGSNFYVTDYFRLGMRSDYYAARLAGVSRQGALPGGFKLAGIDANGNVYMNGWVRSNDELINRIRYTAPQTEWSYHQVDHSGGWNIATGGFAADTGGNFFISRYMGLSALKIDSAGNPTTIPGVGIDNLTLGTCVDPGGATLYQTNYAYHRIEQVTVASGARTILPYGLSLAGI
ncbi:MAG: hypothetical protein HY692_09015 [Cyanobacteria bacterium NC_groundwater_1444_Ag_S-0.65um_54_12]|nr:hypothetical protein [Cyanobacteria bacterium NC_groundwater_1444_Ag_S-0.65um_54_12]